MICEKCWDDAYFPAQYTGESQYTEYKKLLEKRKGNPCTPKQQAGQYWDEETQSDRRKESQ